MYPIVYDKGDIYLENKIEILDKVEDFFIEEDIDGIKELHLKISVENEKFYSVDDESRIKFGNNHFIIKEVKPERKDSGEVVAYIKAFLNATVELRGHMNEVLTIDTLNATGALNAILQGNNYGWTIGTIDVPEKFRTLSRDWHNALDNLYKAKEIWGGYIVFDSINRKVHLRDSIGEDKGFRIQYGKNLKNIKKNVDYKSMYTVLYPFGDKDLSVFNYNGHTEFYIENYSHYTEQGIPLEEARLKYRKPHYIKDSNYVEQKALWEDFSKWLAENCRPKRSYDIKFLDRSQFEEFAHEGIPELGDIVEVLDPKVVNDKQRIIKRKIYPYELWRTKFKTGNYTKGLVDILKRNIDSSKVTEKRSDIWDGNVKDTDYLKEMTENKFSDVDYVLNEVANIDGSTVTVKGGALAAGSIMSWAIATDQLVVGDNIAMGPQATLSWDNVTNQPFIPDDGYITTITEDTIQTTNVIARNLEVEAANINGVLEAYQITSEISEVGDELWVGQNADYGTIYLSDRSSTGYLSFMNGNMLIAADSTGYIGLAAEEILFNCDYVDFGSAEIYGSGMVKTGNSQDLKMQVYNGNVEVFLDGNYIGDLVLN